ncbi:tagatose-6-phosphate kinase [Enterococcus hirae]|nr:tagatose-6-phosphate kinase [Enterococcus hirae]
MILKMLGIESTAMGIKAGFTGQYIEDFLKERSIKTDFLEVPGMTRINVFTQVKKEKAEYKLVNKGPELTKNQVMQFLKKIENLKMGDYLCVSGSLPQGVSPAVLVEISRICQKNKVFLIIDSSYYEILDCLPYQPFLLKPNEEELRIWFQTERNTKEAYIFYGKELLKQGAQNVLISLGSEGALFLNKEQVLFGNSPKGIVVNTACAGDSLLGAFLAGWLKQKTIQESLKEGLAAGSSTAFRKGLTDFSDVEELMTQINVIQEEGEKV